MTETVVRARIDATVKTEAIRVLQSMGLTLSDAIRLFLHQVVTEHGIPFRIKAPNSVTLTAMHAIEEGQGLEPITLKQLEIQWNEACEK